MNLKEIGKALSSVLNMLGNIFRRGGEISDKLDTLIENQRTNEEAAVRRHQELLDRLDKIQGSGPVTGSIVFGKPVPQ